MESRPHPESDDWAAEGSRKWRGHLTVASVLTVEKAELYIESQGERGLRQEV